jgi:hypothetical protein
MTKQMIMRITEKELRIINNDDKPFQHLLGGTEENHKNLQSRYPFGCKSIMVLTGQPQLATARNV